MSRAKFEQFFAPSEKCTRLDRELTLYKQMYRAWLAGRESMRDEAIDKLGDFDATKCAQIVAGIEP